MLEWFPVERYLLFSSNPRGQLFCGRVQHSPYQIAATPCCQWSTEPFAFNGFPEPSSDPVSILTAAPVDVQIFPLRRISQTRMISWVDSHCHLQDPQLGDSESLTRVMKSAGITTAVVNSTCEEDWQAVEYLAIHHPNFLYPAFGIHPWQAHTARPGWQERLREKLLKYPNSSVGECGVDQWIQEPSLCIQRQIFHDQLVIATDLSRTVTIHCLKAWSALFEVFAEAPLPPRFLMHSFGGSIEVARRLIPLGAYFSFSGYFLHPRKSALIDVFRSLPRDRILLETDAPSMMPPTGVIRYPAPYNHPANLPAIGEALASALGMSPVELATLTLENTRRCFLGI